ncbi:MAG: hypothetical protein M1828_004733 [Chrysothrix sp. TS-e1954]|nr:MAG: hypothetical protein M1828_004733 [Chrysothrix sp. TS-e1954]
MPNPVPLANQEEEDRRAWVTSHHEVVKLAKDCFGDRFSNNEIFDRLKISRRTGYRALGNDERIGKAPGRKPKIAEITIKEMIDYIENGGCNDVGNVWKHLAEQFAPNCNPKTVQDAVKKSGFRNLRSEVKLEPLLEQQLSDDQLAPVEEDELAARQLQAQQQEEEARQAQEAQQVEQAQEAQRVEQARQEQQQAAIDPQFQQQPQDTLREQIETSPPETIRYVLHHLVAQLPDAFQIALQFFDPYAPASANPPVAQMGSSGSYTDALQNFHTMSADTPDSGGGRRKIVVCRRCDQAFDRQDNTMENRHCLYHKGRSSFVECSKILYILLTDLPGSPQKIAPEEQGTIQDSPDAFIWSCCGGNGAVRGCCRAMHTTKKKRKYTRKRDASAAGLDDGDSGQDESTMLDESQLATPLQNHIDSSNIDSSLQDLQPASMPRQMQMHLASQMGAPQASMQHHEQMQEQMHGQNGLGGQDDLQQGQMPGQDLRDGGFKSEAEVAQSLQAQLQMANAQQTV